MRAEDRCPATGRACRNSACERGGCVKMRAGSTAAERPAPAAGGAGSPDLPSEMARLRAEAAAAVAAQTALESVLGEAIDALELGDAVLTHLQQSLGVKSSPRLEQLRTAKAKLRGVLRSRAAVAVKAAAASESSAGVDTEAAPAG
jgi:hypothetical protein